MALSGLLRAVENGWVLSRDIAVLLVCFIYESVPVLVLVISAVFLCNAKIEN